MVLLYVWVPYRSYSKCLFVEAVVAGAKVCRHFGGHWDGPLHVLRTLHGLHMPRADFEANRWIHDTTKNPLRDGELCSSLPKRQWIPRANGQPNGASV